MFLAGDARAAEMGSDELGPDSGVGEVRRAERAEAERVKDDRACAIWREWLSTLAGSADAALAAAIAYERLEPMARLDWLLAIEQEASELNVPLIAAYGPLLAVEEDPARRAMMEAALRRTPSEIKSREEAMCRVLATEGSSVRRVVVLAPTYLDFQQVVTARLVPGVQFLSVTREPFVLLSSGPRAGEHTADGKLEAMPLGHGVDLLARTIVAHPRSAGPVPPQLRCLAELFGAYWN